MVVTGPVGELYRVAVRARHAREHSMGILDKFRSKAEKVAGEAKEKAGETTGDENLQASGKADRATGEISDQAHEVADEVKGKAQGAAGDAKDAFDDKA
jgi:uncharacterized protein YjbJ (UPF0337 family)